MTLAGDGIFVYLLTAPLHDLAHMDALVEVDSIASNLAAADAVQMAQSVCIRVAVVTPPTRSTARAMSHGRRLNCEELLIRRTSVTARTFAHMHEQSHVPVARDQEEKEQAFVNATPTVPKRTHDAPNSHRNPTAEQLLRAAIGPATEPVEQQPRAFQFLSRSRRSCQRRKNATEPPTPPTQSNTGSKEWA